MHNLYLLLRVDIFDKSNIAAVVSADNEREARLLAEPEANEPGFFLDDERSSCEFLGVTERPKGVIESF